MTATPSVNVTPVTTIGKRFSPFSLRQVFEAAKTSLKTISLAVFCDSVPFVRTVRCRTVVYVDERAMTSLVEDGADGNHASLPDFACAFRRDPALARRLERIQAVLHRPDLALQRDAALVAFGEVVATLAKDGESAGRNGLASDRRSGALVDYLHAHVGEDVSLEALASLAGLGRRQTIDLFRRRTGLPPHAYHLGLKVRLVQDLLRQGCSPAFAAAEAGFADQSHMTRHFTAIVGTTPGVYARA